MKPAMTLDMVRLNVGGMLFTTTKATLNRYPNSMLGAMFKGTFSHCLDENGYYFIDRDGAMFGYILNFLRSSQLALPEDFKHLDQLAVEADFFQIQPLIEIINELRNKEQNKNKCNGRILEVIEVRTGSIATMPTNNSRVKTIVSGRCDTICSLPCIGPLEKLQHINEKEFTELELTGSNVRLKLAEFLKNEGWVLMDSNISSSSGYDSKSMISSLIIEQTYRDRWFYPEVVCAIQKDLECINDM